MASSLVWHGLAEFRAGLDKAVAETYAAGQRGANNAAAAVERATKEKLRLTTHRIGEPTPSKPGNPPSLVTGQLRRSVLIVPAQPKGATAWVAKVGPTAVYSRIQEFGGDTGRWHRTHLPPRPYLVPALNELIGSGALWAAFRSGYRF